MNRGTPQRYSESRPIRPFRISESALAACAFRINDSEDFRADQPWSVVIDPEEIGAPQFNPELRIEVDADSLSRECGLHVADLALSVVVRDQALWKSSQVAQWPVLETPHSFRLGDFVRSEMSGVMGLEVVLQVTPGREVDEGFRTASRPGQMVARRVFRISIPFDGAEFPVEAVDASYFVTRGFPEGAVWLIDWKTSVDFDRPAEDVLQVMINRDAADKILRLSSSDGVGRVLWAEIATEIFVEICMVVFGSDPEPPEAPGGLLAKLNARLRASADLELETMVAKARNVFEGYSFFRAHLQSALQLRSHVGKISLAGRSL